MSNNESVLIAQLQGQVIRLTETLETERETWLKANRELQEKYARLKMFTSTWKRRALKAEKITARIKVFIEGIK